MKYREALPSLAVVGLLALALPMRLPESAGAASKEVCLTLAEHEPGRPLPAAETIEQCLALYPDDVELIADLAATYETSDPGKAESTLKRAIVLDPADGDLRLRLGRLLLRRGALDEARAAAAAGLRVQPNRLELLELQREARAR